MSDQAVIKAEARTDVGKQAAKHLRQEGRLPAVVYGESQDPVKCVVDRKDLEDILQDRGRNAILTLDMANGGGAGQHMIIKEIQHHPLRREILHVDLHRISLTQKINVEVRIEGEGTPVGVRLGGGILEHMLHHLEVECLPTEIPDAIRYDVSEMEVGDSVHVSDLSVEGDVSIVTEGDRSVFVVAPPTVAQVDEEDGGEEEVLDEEEEMQEPEVIERGKREEEDSEDENPS